MEALWAHTKLAYRNAHQGGISDEAWETLMKIELEVKFMMVTGLQWTNQATWRAKLMKASLQVELIWEKIMAVECGIPRRAEEEVARSLKKQMSKDTSLLFFYVESPPLQLKKLQRKLKKENALKKIKEFGAHGTGDARENFERECGWRCTLHNKQREDDQAAVIKVKNMLADRLLKRLMKEYEKILNRFGARQGHNIAATTSGVRAREDTSTTEGISHGEAAATADEGLHEAIRVIMGGTAEDTWGDNLALGDRARELRRSEARASAELAGDAAGEALMQHLDETVEISDDDEEIEQDAEQVADHMETEEATGEAADQGTAGEEAAGGVADEVAEREEDLMDTTEARQARREEVMERRRVSHLLTKMILIKMMTRMTLTKMLKDKLDNLP